MLTGRRWRSGNQTTGGFGAVSFNTDVYMRGGVTSSSGEIEVPADGLYLIVAGVHVGAAVDGSSNPAGGARNGVITVNGSTYLQEFGATVEQGEVRLSGLAVADLTAGDTIGVSVYQGGYTAAVESTYEKDVNLTLYYLGEPATFALTDASTVAIDADYGTSQRVTVAGNRTIGKPSNGADGQRLVLEIEQDGTGSRVWTLHADYRLRPGDTVQPSTTPGARDKLAVQYDSGDDKWDVLAFLRGDGDTGGNVAKPWEFYVEDYGAKGDGKMILDAAISSSSTTLTSSTANFTSADVGKAILINGAGASATTYTSGALITTISAVTNSTTVTLAASASRTVTAAQAMYGTDDTQAIWDTLDALVTSDNWVGGTYYCELIFQPKIYMLATAPTPGGDLVSGNTYGNAQIPLPFQADYTATKPTIIIRGARDGDYKGLWLQTDPQPSGTCLFSTLESSGGDATYGPLSVIGGPTVTSHWGDPNACNNVQAVIDGIQIMVPLNPGLIGIDMYRMAAYRLGTVSMMPFAGPTGTPNYAAATTNTNGLGFRTNYTGLNDRCDIDNLSVEGFYISMTADEHMAVHSAKLIYSHIAVYLGSEVAAGSNRSSHGCWFGYLSAEITDYCVYAATGGGGSLFSLNVDLLDNEGSTTEHIHDPNNALTGTINIMPTSSASLPQTCTVNGGKNLRIQDVGKPRGAVTSPLSTPSVPATTVALKNPFYRDAIVYVSGGTVSAIAVDGVTTGLTSGPILLPSGLEITLTYSSAPTWAWVLS